MKKMRLSTLIIGLLIIGVIITMNFLVELPKPLKAERIWGEVESVNGNYLPNKDPKDCHIIVKFEDGKTTHNVSYRVEYNSYGPIDESEYDRCWKSLLLKKGDSVSAIKRTWPDGNTTWELDP